MYGLLLRLEFGVYTSQIAVFSLMFKSVECVLECVHTDFRVRCELRVVMWTCTILDTSTHTLVTTVMG